MKENTLKIRIKRPLKEVFEFTTNPKNTPLWISHIQVEEASDWPAKSGTVYRNTSDGHHWDEYFVTLLIPGEVFELAASDRNYHVRYTYRDLSAEGTELTYHEWMKESGELAKPFTQEVLQSLKDHMEHA